MKQNQNQRLNNTVTGIPWYRPEDYQRCRKLFADGDKLHETYQGWLASAEKVEKQLEKEGALVLRIDLDPNTFPAWCLAKGKKLDAEARACFATEAARDACRNANYEFDL